MRGLFGLLPTPYREDLEIHTDDLRSLANFCCESGQHGIVWPVMVGEFYFLGEAERIRHFDVVMEEVNGRLPVMLGCSGVSVSQVLTFARAAQAAGADAVIAMPPVGSSSETAMEMHRRIAEVFEGPLVVQNAGGQYTPLTGEQIEQLLDLVPQIEYVKEERPPGPKHISEVYGRVGKRVKAIFGGAGGRFLFDELNRGALGCMPSCGFGDILAKVFERWWAGDEEGARDLHRRLLPLINLASQPYMKYILKRRGVLSSLVERAPSRQPGVDDYLKQEISILLRAIEGDIDTFPFGPA
jgi:4-hydroxy-tetrahydrodipicolinate synthase